MGLWLDIIGMNKLGIRVINNNNINEYFNNHGNCIYHGYAIKSRDINYNLYGISIKMMVFRK